MKDRHFIILIVLGIVGYAYWFGIPERPVATGGNPFAPSTPVYTYDTSDPQVTIATATPGRSIEGAINFAVIDTGNEPEIVNLVPVLPTQGPLTQQPEAIIDYAEVIAQPTSTPRTLSDEQLLACLSAQQDGRRMAPYCPTNPAELLGEGR